MQADVIRILTEPENALIRQYTVLLATENVALVFRDDAIAELARVQRGRHLSSACLAVMNKSPEHLFAIALSRTA